MHQRAVVVGGQQRIQLAGVGAERVGERLGDPARMGVHERDVPDGIGLGGRGELVDPGLLVAPSDGAQHAVDETGSRRIEFDAGLLDGGGHRGVRVDPGAQQLVGAQPQQVEQHRVDVVRRASRGRGDDGVEQAAGAAGAVGQFGGEGGVAAGDAALAQQRGQHEVGVGVAFRDRAQHVERRAARRIERLAARPAGFGHDAVADSSSRAPRAQSAASIGFLPGGWMRPSSTGCDAVPTRTPLRSTRIAPGASGFACRVVDRDRARA